jgi:hypothetical protein
VDQEEIVAREQHERERLATILAQVFPSNCLIGRSFGRFTSGGWMPSVGWPADVAPETVRHGQIKVILASDVADHFVFANEEQHAKLERRLVEFVQAKKGGYVPNVSLDIETEPEPEEWIFPSSNLKSL